MELCQLLKPPYAKPWRDGPLHKLARLAQGRKNQTKKITNTIHFNSPDQKPMNKKQPMLELLSATDHKKKTLIEFKSLLEVTKSTI